MTKIKLKQKILGRTGLSVSRLAFGTAEIGSDYGIGKRNLPTEKEAIDLLKKVVDMGINFFDTASFYGLAEERVGKSGIMNDPDVIVTTKCARFLEAGEDPRGEELEGKIRADVESSLKRLGIDSLQLLQLHGGSVEQIKRGEIIDILDKLKKEGKVKFVGISTRGEEAYLAALSTGFFDTIQVAHSILDQRMVLNVMPKANQESIGIINRSVLLKGSLTPAVSSLPSSLEELKRNSEEANRIAKSLGISLPALAIRFALSNELVDTILLGTNSEKHLKEAVEAINEGPLPKNVVERLSSLAITDINQTDPSRWN